MRKISFIPLLLIVIITSVSCKEESNKKPLLDIVSPIDNLSVYKNDSVLIAVNANDPDGLIASIDFIVDEIYVHQAKITPYQYMWHTESESSGLHGILIVATDNEGAKVTSSINVRINTEAPVVITLPIAFTGTSLAIGEGIIESVGIPDILYMGLCWNKEGAPTIENSSFVLHADTGKFSGDIMGLDLNSKYFFRAYGVGNDTIVYGEELSFTTAESYYSETGTFIDERDSNEYKWVKIGSQIWMAENVRYLVDDIRGYYAFGESNKKEYFYDISTAKIASPVGWHVPTKAEWEELINYLGGYEIAGSHLKMSGNTYWNEPNTDATNNSLFGALAAGKFYYWRSSSHGFEDLGVNAYFVVDDVTLQSYYNHVKLTHISGGVLNTGFGFGTYHSFSLRCIKDY